MIIAIDGFSSCGKSTLAKDLARELQLLYIDSGAMYRAVTWYFIQNDIDIKDVDQVQQSLQKIDIRFDHQDIFLNEENVSRQIRYPEVASLVSPVAAISEVRKKLVELQKSYGEHGSVIMDGRDIGTVVFPHADLKFFVTASLEVRTERRYQELRSKGIEITFEETKKNLSERDRIDSTRADSPLIQAEDAILLDTTYLNRAQQLELALSYLP